MQGLSGYGFQWPWALLALALAPLLAYAYARALRGRARLVALHPDAAALARLGAPTAGVRRHVPAALYLLALAASTVALARPSAPLPVPDTRTTVMLSVDVSLSMAAKDVPPTRLEAAQRAARAFVRAVPQGLKLGLVSFAGYAVQEVAPTADHRAILDAIDRLQLGRGTAVADGLEVALRGLPGRDGDGEASAAGRRSLPPAAVVLLSDGRNNRPGDPLAVAATARELGVKVFTVGLGTENGFLELGEFGGGFLVGFDAEALRAIASTTGGEYYEARTAGRLEGIYRGLGRTLGWTTKPTEATAVAGAVAALLLAAALAVSELVVRRVA